MTECIATEANGGLGLHPIPPGATSLAAGVSSPAKETVHGAFAWVCRTILLDSSKTGEHQHLIRVLNDTGTLVPMIADPRQTDTQQAIQIAQIAVNECPGIIDQLGALVEKAQPGSRESIDCSLRALHVLESVCPREHLVLRLLEMKDVEPRVRSKITLALGRLTQSPKWLLERLKDQDPRVRANAIEGMWTSDIAGLESILQEAARDPHHRIAANAALGLYALGDPSAVHILHSMLRNDGEMFRRAALWGIERVLDLRYESAVAGVAENGLPEERVIAARVLKRFAEHRAALQFQSVLSLEITDLSVTPGKDTVAGIRCNSDSTNRWIARPAVSALNFIIAEDGQQMEKYALHGPEPGEPFTAIIVTPSLRGAFGELLKTAWPDAADSDRIGVIQYSCEALRAENHAEASPVRLENSIQPLLTNPEAGTPHTLSLASASQVALNALCAEPGRKALFLLVQPGALEPVSPHLLAAAVKSGVCVHALVASKVAPDVADSLRVLTASSRGRYFAADSLRSLIRQIVLIRSEYAGRMELSWRSANHAPAQVRITCFCDYGYSEAAVQAPATRKDV